MWRSVGDTKCLDPMKSGACWRDFAPIKRHVDDGAGQWCLWGPAPLESRPGKLWLALATGNREESSFVAVDCEPPGAIHWSSRFWNDPGDSSGTFSSPSEWSGAVCFSDVRTLKDFTVDMMKPLGFAVLSAFVLAIAGCGGSSDPNAGIPPEKRAPNPMELGNDPEYAKQFGGKGKK